MLGMLFLERFSAECAIRSEPVIADLPLESRVNCISDLPLARLEVALGARQRNKPVFFFACEESKSTIML